MIPVTAKPVSTPLILFFVRAERISFNFSPKASVVLSLIKVIPMRKRPIPQRRLIILYIGKTPKENIIINILSPIEIFQMIKYN